MKNHIVLFVFLIGLGVCQAQKAKAPVIVEKVNQGEQIVHGSYALFFEKVLVDSRCPSDATCVRAGEAKVLVSIVKDGKTENRTIEVPNSAKKVKTSLKMGEGNLQIYGLQPYPTTKSIGRKKNYYLQVKFK